MTEEQKPYLSEFSWILIGQVVLLGLVFAGEQGWLGSFTILRVIFGLAYVLFLPGYVLQVALFPRHTDLDGIERTVLSFGFSIAIVALIALLINRLIWGVQLWTIALTESALLVLISVVAIWRRGRLPYHQRFHPTIRLEWRRFWSTQDRIGKSLVILLGIALLIALGITISTIALPREIEAYTEFYILGSEDMAENYPRQGRVGQSLQVTIGIANFEGVATDYQVWVTQDDQLIGQAGPFHLSDKQTTETPLTFTPIQAGDNTEVLFYLYRSSQLQPYRSLRLRLNIEPAQ